MQEFNNEDEFQSAVESLVAKYGWKYRHFHQRDYIAGRDAGLRMPSGIPDLILSKEVEGQAQPIIFFTELKRDTTNLEDHQRIFLEFFSSTVACIVWRPQNLASGWIEDILKYGPPEPTGGIIEESNSPPLGAMVLESHQNTEAKVHTAISEIRSTGFPRGDLAGLRRMNPDAPKPTSFLHVMAKVGYPRNPDDEIKWALILHGIALMTPNAHNSSMSVGKALFLGGENNRQEGRGFYSRSRLNKLLNARGKIRRALLARMFRMMANTGQPFNWYEMADFILNEDDKEASEQARRLIAREYYRAERRNS